MAGVGKDYVFAEMLAPANLVVTKVVAFAPGTAAMAMNGVYSFNVTCQTPTDTYPGAITITAGNTGFANIGLPAGSSACEVTEDGKAIPAAPVNTQWLPATYQQPDQGAVVAGGVLNATMTNTLASTISGLSVSLQVQGGPAGYVPAPRAGLCHMRQARSRHALPRVRNRVCAGERSCGDRRCSGRCHL